MKKLLLVVSFASLVLIPRWTSAQELDEVTRLWILAAQF